VPVSILGVADLGYKRLNRFIIETSIDKAWGFSTYFFHTLIKQRLILFPSPGLESAEITSGYAFILI